MDQRKRKSEDQLLDQLLAEFGSEAPETPEPDYEPEPAPMTEEPMEEPEVPEKKQKKKKEKKKKHGSWVITILFYLLLIGAVAFCFFQVRSRAELLHEELMTFEKAQPRYRCQEIFDSVFADPDWADLYVKAGIQDTAFEGKEEFAAHMQEKVGEESLTYREVQAASGKRYEVLLGEEMIGAFTISDHSTDPDAPDWQLDGVEVYFTRQQGGTIQMQAGHTATVNGVPLDETYLVASSSLTVQDGTEGGKVIPQSQTMAITGLLRKPELAILDAQGNPVEAVFDEEHNTLTEQVTPAAITPEQEELVWDTVKTYCSYMANKSSQGDIGKYFKRGTATWKALAGSVLVWVQKDRGMDFANEKLTNFAPLGDDMFVARISMTFQLTRPDGSIKESAIDESLYFEKQENGNWLCTQMTAVDVFQPHSDVKLTFLMDGQELSGEFVDSHSRQVTCPQVTAPEGETFSGWMTETVDGQGNPVMQRIFVPDESSMAPVPQGMILEPMTLYPVFTAAA